MEEKNQSENKVKRFFKKNWGVILGVTAVAGCVAATVIASKSGDDEPTIHDRVPDDEGYNEALDKTYIMEFLDGDTDEVYWKERCTKEYVDQVKQEGMQYEAVRKLNGLE